MHALKNRLSEASVRLDCRILNSSSRTYAHILFYLTSQVLFIIVIFISFQLKRSSNMECCTLPALQDLDLPDKGAASFSCLTIVLYHSVQEII